MSGCCCIGKTVVAVTLRFKSSGRLDRLVDRMALGLSNGLNDTLYQARDKLIRETGAGDVRAARGRKVTVKRQRLIGRAVLQIKPSTEADLTGSIVASVDTEPGPKIAANTASDLIRGFVHSTAPSLAGKSREQRIKMALAAWYRRQRIVGYRRKISEQDMNEMRENFNQFAIEAALYRFPRNVRRQATSR